MRDIRCAQAICNLDEGLASRDPARGCHDLSEQGVELLPHQQDRENASLQVSAYGPVETIPISTANLGGTRSVVHRLVRMAWGDGFNIAIVTGVGGLYVVDIDVAEIPPSW